MKYWAYGSYATYDVLLLACLLTGCLCMRKSWPLEYKLLVFLVALTIGVEGVIQFTTFLTSAPTYWLYNLFIPVEAGCIVYVLLKASMHRVFKQLQIALLIILPIGLAVTYSLHPFFLQMNEPAGIFLLFVELLSSCFFLIDALLDQSDDAMSRRPFFWLTGGLLIFCSNYILLHAFISYATMRRISEIYYLVDAFIANAFMYTGFIACFRGLRPIQVRQSPGKSFG